MASLVRSAAALASVLALTVATAVTAGATTPGDVIVFSATPQGSQIDQLFAVQPSGDGLKQLTTGALPAEAPALSPVGTRLAFERSTVGIFTMNVDGTGLRRLTTNGRDSYPAWSPDGNSIAFVRPRGAKWVVYVVPSSGGRPRPLSNAPPAGRPSWTKAGLLIPSGGDLLRIDPANGHVLKYYGANIDAIWGLSSVALSPTLSTLTYLGARAPDPGDKACGGGPCQRFGLYIESLASKSKKPRMIVKDAGPATFSPNGSQIVFTAGGELKLRSVGSGATRTIPTGTAYPTNAAPPAWR
jgi:dipeptidyl aminopeptidase/acylaminoacyl peptidase